MRAGIMLFVFSLSIGSAFSQTPSFSCLPVDLTGTVRGLSVIDDSIAWFSGSKGTVGITYDGGRTWELIRVKGYEESDFRTIYAFSKSKAVIANAGAPSYILITTDGGKNWKQVYNNDNPLCFIDGADFWNETKGVVYGDPLDGHIFMMTTVDGGYTWNELPLESRPSVTEGEASFAASGTGLRCYGKRRIVMITGGKVSRLHISANGGKSWISLPLPVIQGEAATGAFSVAFNGRKEAIIVGGDYTKEEQAVNHIFRTSDGGKTWQKPEMPTRGFRECVIYLNENEAIAVGPSGSEYSDDRGVTWQKMSDDKGFHVISMARKGSLVLAAGNKKISIIIKR